MEGGGTNPVFPSSHRKKSQRFSVRIAGTLTKIQKKVLQKIRPQRYRYIIYSMVRDWQEEAMTYFMVIFQYSPGGY